MKNKKIHLFTLSALFLAFPLAASAYDVLMMGGGGEPKGDITIFDDDLRGFSKSKIPNMDVKVSFNGGHAKTTAIIEEEIKVPVTPFTKENYKKMISDALEKINSGKIKTGEQLLVIVDTHGGENNGKDKTVTHSIAMSGKQMSNMTTISGSDSSTMDELMELSKAALDKGIKLGIMDLSCHSGHSLKLANKNTCVISSTGTNHFGYGTFATSFYSEMKPGRTMEDVYLSARIKEIDHGFPMISTGPGVTLNETQYKLFTPYLNNRHDANADKVTGYISQAAKSEDLCARENDFKKLLQDVADFEKIAGVARSKYAGTAVLKDELIAYKEMQDSLLRELNNLNYKLLDKKESISFNTTNPKTKKSVTKTTDPMSYQDILNFPKANLEFFEERLAIAKKAKYARDIEDYTEMISRSSAILQKQEELKKNFPELLNVNKVFEKIPAISKSIMDKAFNVSQLSRKMYDQKYKELAKADTEENPCKDFKF